MTAADAIGRDPQKRRVSTFHSANTAAKHGQIGAGQALTQLSPSRSGTDILILTSTGVPWQECNANAAEGKQISCPECEMPIEIRT